MLKCIMLVFLLSSCFCLPAVFFLTLWFKLDELMRVFHCWFSNETIFFYDWMCNTIQIKHFLKFGWFPKFHVKRKLGKRYTETTLPPVSSSLIALALANFKIFHMKEFHPLKYFVWSFSHHSLKFPFLLSTFRST